MTKTFNLIMDKKIFLFFKELSFNNIVLLVCLISNSYSSYLQHKRNQEILALIQEERKNIIQLLDNKLEKFNYSLQLWTEKSNVGIEKVKNKISLIQDKMTDQHFLLASNIMQPQKVDSSFKITLFDQFFFPSLFQYIIFGIFISGCIYFFYSFGCFNPFSYFDTSKFGSLHNIVSKVSVSSKNSSVENVGKDSNILLDTAQDIIIIDPNSTQPFVPSSEDLELINMHISSLFK
jgi:hypothetical protein